MTSRPRTRQIEIALPIQAPLEAVWAALTDPEELTRWFPLEAGVVPGEGGKIRLSWGTEMVNEGRIRAWEPPRRLVTGWGAERQDGPGGDAQPAPGSWEETFRGDPEGAAALAVEYTIEAQAGTTVLRMVHSGFRADARWDDEYESHRRGWSFELRSLRHYLENHRGTSRRVDWVRLPIALSREEAWARVMGRGGLVREGTIDGLREGERCALTTVHGDRLEGIVQVLNPPLDFALTVEGWGNALLRYGYETFSGTPEAHLWLSTWGRPAAPVERFRARWQETLGGLLRA